MTSIIVMTSIIIEKSAQFPNLPVSPNALHEPSQETKLLERCFRLGNSPRKRPGRPPSTGLTGEQLLSCHVMRNSEANPLSWRIIFLGQTCDLVVFGPRLQALGSRVRASVDTLYEPGAKLLSCQGKTPTISTA